MQVLLKVREIAHRVSKLSGGAEPEWARVKREATRGGCPFMDELEGHIAYVKELSGGLNNPLWLFEIRDFQKQCSSVRVVRGPILKVLSELKIGYIVVAV